MGISEQREGLVHPFQLVDLTAAFQRVKPIESITLRFHLWPIRFYAHPDLDEIRFPPVDQTRVIYVGLNLSSTSRCVEHCDGEPLASFAIRGSGRGWHLANLPRQNVCHADFPMR